MDILIWSLSKQKVIPPKRADLIRPRNVFVLKASVNTSKQIHLHYSEKNSMHYAVFWLFKSHIHLHYTAKTTSIIQASGFIFSQLLLHPFSEQKRF